MGKLNIPTLNFHNTRKNSDAPKSQRYKTYSMTDSISFFPSDLESEGPITNQLKSPPLETLLPDAKETPVNDKLEEELDRERFWRK